MADIDQLFATFRAEAGTEIRPPGTDAARRTVRRRRSIRLAATAVLAIAAVVSIGLVARGGPGVVGETPATGPTPSLDQRDRLGLEALAQLGYAPTDPSTRPDLRPIRPGIVFGGIGAATEFSYQLGTPAEPMPPGLYHLQALCLGQGSVMVGWSIQSGSITSSEVECGGDVHEEPVPIAAHGVVHVTITSDDEANGWAGVAVVLTDPRLVAARAAIGVPTRTPKSAAETVLYEPMMNVDESGAEARVYRLRVACAGTGTIDITFAAGATSQRELLVCIRDGDVTELTVPALAGASLAVTVEPDDAAKGQAAVVYRVTEE